MPKCFMSDVLLWNELRSGNHQALASIYSSYFELLYQYGTRFSDDTSTVEDCIQELFIDIWNSRERLSETDTIKPYLLLSLKRKIIKTIQKNRKTTDVPLEEYHFDAVLDIEAIILKGEQNKINRDKLQLAFNELSDRQKEIIYLKFYAELDYSAIAEQMEMNYQSARNLLHRAITKLSKHIVIMIMFFYLSEYIVKLMFFS